HTYIKNLYVFVQKKYKKIADAIGFGLNLRKSLRKANSLPRYFRAFWLQSGIADDRAATVKFNITTGKLWYGNLGPINTKTMTENPVPVGKHNLEIPYEVHSLGIGYQALSKYAKTWFRIGHSGDRFLHPGRISAGCVTVTDIAAWTRIYEYLIKSRKGDGKSVGTIEVIK
ncbi:MAG: hypothetical protein JJV92_05895, partial [Desulfosarcina sp.]|nr:hypothetical protein [Desulfobacterales bacterium]